MKIKHFCILCTLIVIGSLPSISQATVITSVCLDDLRRTGRCESSLRPYANENGRSTDYKAYIDNYGLHGLASVGDYGNGSNPNAWSVQVGSNNNKFIIHGDSNEASVSFNFILHGSFDLTAGKYGSVGAGSIANYSIAGNSGYFGFFFNPNLVQKGHSSFEDINYIGHAFYDNSMVDLVTTINTGENSYSVNGEYFVRYTTEEFLLPTNTWLNWDWWLEVQAAANAVGFGDHFWGHSTNNALNTFGLDLTNPINIADGFKLSSENLNISNNRFITASEVSEPPHLMIFSLLFLFLVRAWNYSFSRGSNFLLSE